MKYCKRCTYPENHPLNLVIDDEGICSGCRVHEEKDTLNWDERFEKLRKIAEEYRDESGKNYDCIVPVSGGRDSYFILHVVKNILKLNPLLVSYNKHFNTGTGIRNLAYLRIAFNCDYTEQVVGVDTVKAITRASLREMGSMYWHEIAGRTVLPVRSAVDYKVPLIIWGAHQGCDQVGMFSHLDEVEMTRKYRKEHDLMGVEGEDLAKRHPELNSFDLNAYIYPSDAELSYGGVRGIYLSNYMRWDSKAQHELMIKHFNYKTAPQQRTIDTYNHVDCFHYDGLHDYIKFLKWGYSRIHDHTSREIRLKRMTRSTAVHLISQYQPIVPNDTQMFLDWLGMSESELWSTIDQHRSASAWEQTDEGWILKDIITNHPSVDWDECTDNCDFTLTTSYDSSKVDDRYILIGRGFVDGQEPRRPIIGDWLP